MTTAVAGRRARRVAGAAVALTAARGGAPEPVGPQPGRAPAHRVTER